MGIQSQIRKTVEKYNLLSAGDRVVVGVSGGPDSIAMLHLLLGFRRERGLHLEVAHVMHGIRGEEAQHDARFVAGLANKLGLGFHLKEIDVPREKAKQGKGNIEAIGREKRYEFFASVMRRTDCNKVATGHTRDDQVETMLMWLFRGGGRGALGGIPPCRFLNNAAQGEAQTVIRPLIEISKKEIVAYLKKEKLSFRRDRTNLDPGYLRNWVRLRLLPELRRRTDPRLDVRLARLSDLVWEEEKLLEDLTRARLQKVTQNDSLQVHSFLCQEKALQRRLIRLWLQENGSATQGLGFDHVEGCLRLLARGPAQGRLCLPRGWEVAREYDVVKVQRRQVKRPNLSSYRYILSWHQDLVIPEAGVRVRSSVHPWRPSLRPADNWHALFDLRRISPTLTLRNFRTGDRFQPLGMKGHKKVKDLFIDQKVPARDRRTLPFLLSGEAIVWIPGYARSELAKVGPDTREVLKVEVQSTLDPELRD